LKTLDDGATAFSRVAAAESKNPEDMVNPSCLALPGISIALWEKASFHPCPVHLSPRIKTGQGQPFFTYSA
jgi:hypothetical protein